MSISKTIAAAALALAASFGVAAAQAPEGRLYAFHSKAQAGCPALDWHITIRAKSTLSGTISWNDAKSIAFATGSINVPKATFSMSAQELRGLGRIATIDGQVRQDGWLVANVKGEKITCTGILVPWYVAPPGSDN